MLHLTLPLSKMAVCNVESIQQNLVNRIYLYFRFLWAALDSISVLARQFVMDGKREVIRDQTLDHWKKKYILHLSLVL